MLDDTIAAIATPIGESGLAVLRVSGPKALAVADRCFKPAGNNAPLPSKVPSHTVHYGWIVRRGETVDEVLLSVFRAPRTFTREDLVEISCHGGVLVVRSALETLLESGARLAEPGEFTRRAFLNGRIDLTQAEAVLDLIHARTELSLTAAQEQLAGSLARRIGELRDQLMKTLAHIEAHLDFPDEEIPAETKQGFVTRLGEISRFARRLIETGREGQILRRGIRAAIVGRPNCGKSSLLNQLLGHDRAIVSPVAGTTRDTIEETANIRGLPIIFIDTAGLRETSDAIEQEGVRRSRTILAQAELILQILDRSEPLSSEDEVYLREFESKPRIVVLNKCDLPGQLMLPGSDGDRPVEISCKSGVGIEALKEAIKDLLWAGEIKTEMLQVAVNARHRDALIRAETALGRALEGLESDLLLELIAMELRTAAQAIGEIVGKTTTEDLLDSIFSQFCIGK